MKTGKRLLSVALAMFMLLSIAPISSFALDATGQRGDNAYWSFDESNGELVISGEGPMYDYDGSQSPFEDSWKIKRVVISDGITSIGVGALAECTKLTNIEVDPNNACLSSVDGVLFNKDKTTLIQYPTGDTRTSYIIPDSVTDITDWAFSNCRNLTSITIPNGVQSIGYRVFYCCHNLMSITIPDSVTSIGELAFYYCDSLTNITIPDSVTSIGNDAFNYCKNLTSITIGESVTNIDSNPFGGCMHLANIEVAPNNTCYSSVDGVLFNKDKTTLIRYSIGNTRTSYIIPDSVTGIDRCAFYDCNSLTNITIPDSVTSIGDYAFGYCNNLTSITIGESVTSIGYDLFVDCYSLTNIEVAPYNTCYSSVDGVLFNKDKTTLIQYPIGNTRKSYTIPDSVTSIGSCAFGYCNNLTSITIPDSVTSIGFSAFYNTAYYNNPDNWIDGVLYLGHCLLDVKNIEGIEIPENITVIADYAFSYSGVTEATIHGKIKTIPSGAFDGCYYLEKLTIKEGVQRIEDNAFDDCTRLSEIVLPTSVEYVGYYAFRNTAYYNDESNWTEDALYIGEWIVDVKPYITEIFIKADNKLCEELLAYPEITIERITVDENNPYYSSDEYGVLFNKDKTKLLCYPAWSENIEYTIPDTVKEVEAIYALQLKKLTIPESVKKFVGIAGFKLKNVFVYNDELEIDDGSMLGKTILDTSLADFEKLFDEYCELWIKLAKGTATEEEQNRIAELNELLALDEEIPYGTIHANPGSNAHKYAVKNGIDFESLSTEEPHACSFGEWFTEIEPTVFNEGVSKRICECGKFETKPIAKLESVSEKDEATKVEVTYTEENFETEISLVVSEDAVNANIAFGDEYENYKAFDISIEANGEKVQPKGYVTVKLPIPADFNAETTVVYYVDENGNKTKLESTTENGYIIFETDHFSEYVLVDESTKHEHNYKSTVTKEPTCTEPGVKTFTCSCNDSYTESIPATGHSHKAVTTAPTCTEKGYTTYTCSCGDSYVADYVNALGHKDDNGDYKCDNGCGYEYEKPAEPEVPSDPSEDCSCNCHKSGITNFFFKIILFFQRLFGINKICSCGISHY